MGPRKWERIGSHRSGGDQSPQSGGLSKYSSTNLTGYTGTQGAVNKAGESRMELAAGTEFHTPAAAKGCE